LNLHLVDIDADVVAAWRRHFASFDDVDIQDGDILRLARNTIVSPANGYGNMDGGIDALYTEHFGSRPQIEIQDQIARLSSGYLRVGQALLVSTGDPRIPHMISAPTMIVPEPVPASNCFFAMSAILRTASLHPQVVTDVFCPGLCTGTGLVPPDDAAREMALAYTKFKARIT
jgi:O-acetyl-ADP-ribose deacetylase (regulator of RNase III)